ncbi:tRNA synthetases class II-domain-containing protein [Xylariaceae sp. FL0594]|nr:tRNA synthetases class II-domain-containing protein [Xylariaceae sp. FL0594]
MATHSSTCEHQLSNDLPVVRVARADPINWAFYQEGKTVTINGFLGKRRTKSPRLTFVDIQMPTKHRGNIQVVSSWEEKGTPEHQAQMALKSIPAHSAVSITGTVKLIKPRNEHSEGEYEEDYEDQPNIDLNKPVISTKAKKLQGKPRSRECEVVLESIRCLNTFDKDIIVSDKVAWPPKFRHLQMRFDQLLFERLCFRDDIQKHLEGRLRDLGFMGVETPVLFKSTPEGAREFLVPTRKRGFAYALPQSPQQYKQLLMSGGVPNYFQFAKCFRDEDHRADRQPEFTQLDLEMSFATGKTVQRVVSQLMHSLFKTLNENYVRALVEGDLYNGTWQPVRADNAPLESRPFPRIPEEDLARSISYEEAMRRFGIDKPDLRIGIEQASQIMPITHLVSDDFKRMLTKIEDPIIEACKFRLDDAGPNASRKFMRDFFDALPNTTNRLSGESTPGVFVFDWQAPQRGLSALGHEAAAALAEAHPDHSWLECSDSDIIIVHARRNERLLRGGSTELGRLRKLIYDTTVEQGLVKRDLSFQFLWVEKFPMFSPADEDPGQGGAAGIKATHHPFTAPLSPEDVDLLRTDPLRALADHYDLVLNGVEIGGGSRRIHVAEVQEYVMRDVLKMSPEGVSQFRHLIDALRAGCPPHAGFAVGFDRLVSILCDVSSVRDVIAFPKTNKGDDPLVRSPAKTTLAQQKTYHLFVSPSLEKAAAEATAKEEEEAKEAAAS